MPGVVESEKLVKRGRAGLGAQVSPFMLGEPREAYSIEEFCRAFRISRAMLYILLREGRGPAVFKCGRRTLISVEAAAAWRAKLEAESTKAAA